MCQCVNELWTTSFNQTSTLSLIKRVRTLIFPIPFQLYVLPCSQNLLLCVLIVLCANRHQDQFSLMCSTKIFFVLINLPKKIALCEIPVRWASTPAGSHFRQKDRFHYSGDMRGGRWNAGMQSNPKLLTKYTFIYKSETFQPLFTCLSMFCVLQHQRWPR